MDPSSKASASPWKRDEEWLGYVESVDQTSKFTSTGTALMKPSAESMKAVALETRPLMPILVNLAGGRSPEDVRKNIEFLRMNWKPKRHVRLQEVTDQPIPHSLQDWLTPTQMRSRRRTIDLDVALDARLRTLRALADDEGMPYSDLSESFSRSFILEKQLRNPKLALLPTGFIRAVWKDDDYDVELDFLLDDRIAALFIKKNPAGPSGKYVSDDLSGQIYIRWLDVFEQLRQS